MPKRKPQKPKIDQSDRADQESHADEVDGLDDGLHPLILLVCPEQRLVIAIILADELHDPFQWWNIESVRPGLRPGRDENIRILDLHLVLKAVFSASPAFDGMKRIRMFKSAHFRFVVVPDGIDDERVAFPSSDRIARATPDPDRADAVRHRAE